MWGSNSTIRASDAIDASLVEGMTPRAHVRAYVAVHVRVEALVDSHRVRIKQQWHGGELDNGEHDEIGPSGRQGGACIAFEHWRENGECAGLCAN